VEGVGQVDLAAGAEQAGEAVIAAPEAAGQQQSAVAGETQVGGAASRKVILVVKRGPQPLGGQR